MLIICRPTGILVFGEKDGDNDLKPVLSSLKSCGVPYEVRVCVCVCVCVFTYEPSIFNVLQWNL